MPTKASGYASLQPHTAHVSRARIQKTWRPLPQPTQERVKQLLLSLQKESQAQRRSANLRLDGRQKKKKAKRQKDGDEEEEEETSEQAVREAVDKLIRRIPRMPFPRQHHSSNNKKKNKSTSAGGSSHEADFDFEATLDRIQRLEAELGETVESSKLLREQIRREEAAAAADREAYRMLEAGARSEQSLAREQARKLHPVAREVDMDADADADEVEVEVEEEGFDFDFDFDEAQEEERAVRWTAQQARKQKKSSRAGGLTKSEIEQDEQLKTLVAQLRRHVDSIARNTPGLAGVSDALDDAEQAIWELMATTTATQLQQVDD